MFIYGVMLYWILCTGNVSLLGMTSGNNRCFHCISVKIRRNDRHLPLALVNTSAELAPCCLQWRAILPPLSLPMPPSLPRGCLVRATLNSHRHCWSWCALFPQVLRGLEPGQPCVITGAWRQIKVPAAPVFQKSLKADSSPCPALSSSRGLAY